MTPHQKFQMKFILLVVLIVTVASVVIGGGIYFSIKSEVQYRLPEVTDQGIASEIIFSGVNNLLMWLIPVLFILLVSLSVFLLSRITSPVYRSIEKLSAIAKGDLTSDVSSIKGEDLSDLVKAVNEVKKGLSGLISSEKAIVNEILGISEKLIKECEKDKVDKDRIGLQVKKLQSSLDELQIAQSKFRINK